MTVVRINAITVPQGAGDELARRFASRAGAVDQADGFEGFELLRPTDGRGTWLVVTRWRDEEAFSAWVSSPAFAHGHRGAGEGSSPHGGDAPAHGGDAPAHGGGAPAHGGDAPAHGGDAPAHGGGAPAHGGHDNAPVATSSELWSYDVVDLSSPSA